jgi:transcriptional regulator with XRE-family HTH domain
MNKSERELAFLRDLNINEIYTRPIFERVIDTIGKLKPESILFIKAGTGEACFAIEEKLTGHASITALCENEELAAIAIDKGESLGSTVQFQSNAPEIDHDLIVLDETLSGPSSLLADVLNASNYARSGTRFLLICPISGSFGEIFSVIWEAALGLSDQRLMQLAEELTVSYPTLEKIEQIANESGLTEIDQKQSELFFEYDSAEEFVESPLISDFLFPLWLGQVDKSLYLRIRKILEEESFNLSFRFKLRISMLTGRFREIN